MNNAFALGQATVSLLFLAYVWIFLFGRMGRDAFRCDVRRLRDELFDFMVANGENFDAPAYRKARQMLNGVLRLSNHLNVFTFIAIVVCHARLRRLGRLPDDPSRAPGSAKLKHEIAQVRAKLSERLLIYVFLEGVTGIVVNAILACGSMLRVAAKTKRWANDKSREFMAGAFTAAYGAEMSMN
jgi:hypothetical protein